jgi:hypothetical protein
MPGFKKICFQLTPLSVLRYGPMLVPAIKVVALATRAWAAIRSTRGRKSMYKD